MLRMTGRWATTRALLTVLLKLLMPTMTANAVVDILL